MAGTPMIREQFEALTNLQVALSIVFKDEILMQDDLTALYRIESSSEAEERNQMRGGFGVVPEYKGAIEYDKSELLYRADYEHLEYADGFAIERKLIDDDNYGVMSGMAQDLGAAFDYTVLQHMANTFINATTTLGPDAKALCATDHPYSPTDATTQSNLKTTALSHAEVKNDRRDMLKFKNSRGLAAPATIDGIVIPPDLLEEATVIIESEKKSGTAENDSNSNRGLRIFTSPLLSDTNNWFSVDSRRAKRYLRWYWRIMPELAADPTSDFNLEVRMRGYARWSKGWDDWRWIIGHNVT